MVYLFKDSDNPIDKLIDQLTKAGWETKLSKSKYLTKYKWPNLVFSSDILRYKDLSFDWYKETNNKLDRDISEERESNPELEYLHKNCIELLGCYRFKSKKQLEEGEIVIYYEKIVETALDYCKNHKHWINIHYDHAITHLTKIVMYHEFVHWFMHWVKSSGVRYIPHHYNTRDSVEFHEGFAQLFTYLYVQDDKERLDIFNWLLSSQPPQYHAFKELLDLGVNTIDKAIAAIEVFRINKIQVHSKAITYLKKPVLRDVKTGLKLTLMQAFDHWHNYILSGEQNYASQVFNLEYSKFIAEYDGTAISPMFNKI
jgi:hypothetical protein